ncbi:MAG: hypothetical protein Q4A41_02050, partial [Bacillota bacterium]|nr:hypothetical protein [Bacillota bacterium]
ISDSDGAEWKRKKYIDVLSRHPLYRAMRLDKLSIYALTKTLKAALFKESALVADLIRLNAEELKSRVHRFIRSFRQNVKGEQEYNNSIDNGKLILSGIPIKSGIGGGTFAISEIESYGLEIKIPYQNINSVAKSLRNAEVPLIGRIEDESIILDFRTIMKDDEGLLKLILKNLMYNISLT